MPEHVRPGAYQAHVAFHHIQQLGKLIDMVFPDEMTKPRDPRIISLHFKDLNEFGNPKAYDVPWGKGKGDFAAVLKEIRRLKLKAFFGIEYERNLPDKLPEITECVAWIEKMAKELS